MVLLFNRAPRCPSGTQNKKKKTHFFHDEITRLSAVKRLNDNELYRPFVEHTKPDHCWFVHCWYQDKVCNLSVWLVSYLLLYYYLYDVFSFVDGTLYLTDTTKAMRGFNPIQQFTVIIYFNFFPIKYLKDSRIKLWQFNSTDL